MATPRLSLVVLNWDEPERTERCVSSLRNNTDVPHEVIVVDNGSQPETARRVSDLADVSVLHSTNRGFAPGMNAGLQVASGQFVAFINNDTEFPPEWASRLIETFTETTACGIVMPAVTAAGNQAGVRTEAGSRAHVFAPFTAIPSGVVYMVKRQDAEYLGGFSEIYPIASSEDLDLLFTFWTNGRSVVLDERVLVDHESAASANRLPDRAKRYSTNRLLFADRWANATAETVPRLADCAQEEFEMNLEKARIAATWMKQWFLAMDRADDTQRRLNRIKATSAEPIRGQSRKGMLRTARSLAGKIRRRLWR